MNIFVDPAGRLICGDFRTRCALGRTGVSSTKREGDGTTPVGTFPLRNLLYRPDRLSRPVSRLPIRRLHVADGWCDAPSDPAYNQPVQLPYAGSAEQMWRADHLYDIVVVIGYNDEPPQPGRGSAIFLHLAHPDYRPTEGCVAVSHTDILPLVRLLEPGSTITIGVTSR